MPLLISLADSPRTAAIQVYLLPVVLYLSTGYLISRLQHWPRPNGQTALLAVLLPTLFALGWVAIWVGLGLFGALSGAAPLESAGSVMLFSTFFWAPASAMFVFLSMLYSLEGLPWLWLFCVPLAGLLPPLLFFLGSLLPKKRLTTAKNVIK